MSGIIQNAWMLQDALFRDIYNNFSWFLPNWGLVLSSNYSSILILLKDYSPSLKFKSLQFFHMFYSIVLVEVTKFEWLKIYKKIEYLLLEKMTSKIRMIYFNSSKVYYLWNCRFCIFTTTFKPKCTSEWFLFYDLLICANSRALRQGWL